MQTKELRIALRVTIQNNRLSLVMDGEAGPTTLIPNNPLEAVLDDVHGADRLTLEVRDFAYQGVLYRIYGATLEGVSATGASSASVSPDDRALGVLRHWRATDAGNGVQDTLSNLDGTGRDVRFLIGATPVRAAAPVPAPFAPGKLAGYEGPEDDPGQPTDPE